MYSPLRFLSYFLVISMLYLYCNENDNLMLCKPNCLTRLTHLTIHRNAKVRMKLIFQTPKNPNLTLSSLWEVKTSVSIKKKTFIYLKREMLHFFRVLCIIMKGIILPKDFFKSLPYGTTLRKTTKLELPLILNSSYRFWYRDIRFVLFCSEFSTLQ